METTSTTGSNRKIKFNKKIFIILILGILILLPLVFLGIELTKSPSEKFSNQVAKFIEKNSGGKEEITDLYGDLFKTIQDPNAPEADRYKAVETLAFTFSQVYGETHDPKIREFSETVLGPYAKHNFPKLYDAGVFNLICADTTCGSLDPEITQVLTVLSNTEIDPNVVKMISDNLTTAGYSIDKEDKKVGLGLVYEQLNQTGNLEASKAAVIIKDYAKIKLNLGL